MATNIKGVSTNLVGIGKDGRVIYGPIKSTSGTTDTLYDECDLDICNGMISENTGTDDDGTTTARSIYSYRATTFHPYLVGCFGPGSL